MNNQELEQFRTKLTAMQRELRAVNESAAEDGKPVELDQSSVGRVSRMDAIQAQQMSLETARRREQLLVKIDGALRRIESGRFGPCFQCGEEIDIRRLAADPTITRCRDCIESP
ncbi:MAG TPA: TraR/DksA C4-type zinc finger protein [Nitrospira sp.]